MKGFDCLADGRSTIAEKAWSSFQLCERHHPLRLTQPTTTTMKYGQHWRDRSSSKRRKFVSVLSMSQDSFRAQSIGRARQCYHFFADFWESTPHPIAQMSLVMGWATIVVILNDADILDANLTLESTAGRTLTTILAFLIVFRTNQSYNRWWEGRILWGKMHW